MGIMNFLKESADGKLWRCRLLGVGAGHNRYYPEDVLREAVNSKVFPKGMLIHLDHPTDRERDERPERSVKTVIGALTEDADYVEGDGIYGTVSFMESYVPFIQEAKDIIGLSANIKGAVSEEEIDGKPVVSALYPYPLNTVDVVTVPAQRGKIIHLLESYDIMSSTNENDREDEGMKPEDIDALAEALSTKLTETFVPAITEALKPSVEKDEDEGENVATKDVAEALIDAGLPKVARERVYLAVDEGADITEAVASEKAYMESLRESLDSPGVVRTTQPTKEADLTIPGWSL